MPKPAFLRTLFTSAVLLLATGAALALPPPPRFWKPDIDKLVARDAVHPPPQHGVVFVGSSSIRFWAPTLQSDFPGITPTAS
jgi:hypothetical protein